HLRDTIDWIGWDRLLFATDYPHWDYDDPRYAMKLSLTSEQREAFFSGNARSLYLRPDMTEGVLSETWIRVANAGDIAEGEATPVEIAGLQLAVYRVNGQWYCTDNICTH